MILLKAYSKNNLGDDLFIKIITQRYNHEKFVLINGKNNITFKKIKNLEIKKSIFDKILEKLIYKYSRLELKVSKTASLIVLIGGSMFIQYDNIENVKKRNKFYYLVNKPYYILGTNFGPYKDEEYFLEYKKIFSEAKDICFREKYSYDLFENRLENVRYASDIVFSLKTHQNKNDNTVVISVIDCEKKIGKGLNTKYTILINKFIDYFLNENFKVILMSFCEYEGDEKVILNLMNKNKDRKLEKYFYRGNIEEALGIISNSKVVVGSRFHANILGMLYQKCVVPVAYSDKTLNVLKDLNFENQIFDIRYLDVDSIDKMIQNINLEYIHNIETAKIDADQHFLELDKILGEKDEY